MSYAISVFFPIFDFLSVLVMFIIINSGGKIAIGNGLEVGDLFLFYVYSIRLFVPIFQLAQQVTQIQAGSAATEIPGNSLINSSTKQALSAPQEQVSANAAKDTYGFQPLTPSKM